MKNRFVVFLLSTMLIAASASAADISVFVHGKKVEFDVQPMIINERTMVPVRGIFEKIGAEVEWIGESKLIFANKGSKVIAMTIGENSFKVTDVLSGETRIVELDSPPIIVEERTLVPVRAISEALDMDVEWLANERCVLIKNRV